MKVKFKVKYMDWNKGEVAEVEAKKAKRLIANNTCTAVKPPVKKKQQAAAPLDKMFKGAANKS